MKKLFNLKMLEGGSIQNHINEFYGITDMLVSIEIEFEDEIQAILLLYSFLDSLDGLLIPASNFLSNKGTLKFEDVVSEGILHKSIGEVTYSTNLSVSDRGRQNHRGRSESKDRSKSRSKVKENC